VIKVPQSRQGGFLISKIHKLSQQIFNQKLSLNNLKIHPGQGRILFVLWNEDNIPIKKLVEKTGLPKSTLTSILDRLEKEGQILRESSSLDKRETIIKLTEKNKKLHPIYEKISQEMTDLFYTGFKEKEIQDFEQFLIRLLSNLQKKY